MEYIEQITKGNYILKIGFDEFPDNPRNWDNLGQMVCFHSRYNLGDEHSYQKDNYNSWEELKKDIIKNNGGVILPLYLYDHSGFTISFEEFSCKWDSGQIGFIFASKNKILEAFGGKILTKKLKDRALDCLKHEVNTYDNYLRGDCYFYEISKVEQCCCGHDHEEELDNCGGFFGEQECYESGMDVIDRYIAYDNEKSNKGENCRV